MPLLVLAAVFAGAPFIVLPTTAQQQSPVPPAEGARLPDAAEARVRAQLVHATVHGALSVMHRDFFRKGDNKAIPSESLKDVFKTLSEEWNVTVRWLAAEETIMNVDNRATDDFQRRALKAIIGGEKELGAVENGTFRYAGAIPLQNQCLKCHAPDRKSLEDRFAALEISMAIRKADPAK